MKIRNQLGSSFMEVLVVIVILGVLIYIAIGAFGGKTSV